MIINDLERCSRALSIRILFVTDGGVACLRRCWSGSGKGWYIRTVCSIRARTCNGTGEAVPKRNASQAYRHVGADELYRRQAMLLALEAWLRTKNESAADSILEAFEEFLMPH